MFSLGLDLVVLVDDPHADEVIVLFVEVLRWSMVGVEAIQGYLDAV